MEHFSVNQIGKKFNIGCSQQMFDNNFLTVYRLRCEFMEQIKRTFQFISYYIFQMQSQRLVQVIQNV